MQNNPREDQNTNTRNSTDPRERLQQNPAMDSEEVRNNTAQGDKNDLDSEDVDLDEDLDEEDFDDEESLESSSENRLEEAE